jgi:hypothetical protein
VPYWRISISPARSITLKLGSSVSARAGITAAAGMVSERASAILASKDMGATPVA